MGASDEADDRTFRANFSSDGVVRLQESVKDKLKEFMGDYTDDTLAEYVVVLLRNGRRKEETRKELNVFLEDDSGSFVSWLWDHLSSNLHLYIQPSESDEEAETNNLQREHVIESLDLDSEYKREKPVKVARSQRRRVWNGLIRDAVEPPPLRTSDIESFHAEEKTHHSSSGALKRSWSGVGKELNQQDEQRLAKRDGIKHPVIDAPRRLLQFAVREAVGPMRSTVSRSEPASKRLRSVVSKSTGDTSLDRSQRTRSVARAPLAAAAAQKAAAEAAEDVIKHRSSGNVFDRLGRYMDGAPTLGQDYEDSILMPVSITSDLCQRSEPVLERDTGLASGSESDNGGYDAIGNVGHRFMDTSQTASSRGKDEDSLMVQCSVAQNTDEIIRKTRIKDQDQSAPAVANASRKIVNISVNVNTWKPPHYSSQRDVEEAGSRMGVQDTEAGAGKPGIRISQENSAVVASTEKEVPHMDAQKEAEKTVPSMPGSYSSVRPTEDADSRTVFVCNVHFAATKDLLSRHFNKFGEVLKVIIVTDAATGQPKGSAYVEFMRKEAAELALSLNGTSFMSRILKVVRRGSAHHEAVPMTWPRMPRASPYASRLSRIFARGIPAAFRARLLVKTGPRSLQWKREALDGAKYSQDGAPAAPGSGTALPSPAVRPNTYIRTQP